MAGRRVAESGRIARDELSALHLDGAEDEGDSDASMTNAAGNGEVFVDAGAGLEESGEGEVHDAE